jgi:hypothetical protein
MKFRPRQPFSLTLCLGYLALAVANITRFVLERHTSMPEDARDGLSGVLMGVAIALLLLGIWRMGRSRSGTDEPGCAH